MTGDGLGMGVTSSLSGVRTEEQVLHLEGGRVKFKSESVKKLMIFNSTQTILLQIIWMEWSRFRKGFVYVCQRVKVEWDKNTESESEFGLYMGPEGKHLNGSPRPCWMVRGGVGLVWRRRRWRVGWCPCQDNPPPPLPSIPVFNSMCSCTVLSWRLACRLVGSTIGHLGVNVFGVFANSAMWCDVIPKIWVSSVSST